MSPVARRGRLSEGSAGESAGSQLFCGMEPILLRRSVWTASGLPEFMSQGRNVIVSECGDAMSNRSRLSMLMIVLAVLEASAVYSNTTAVPHEFFDHTPTVAGRSSYLVPYPVNIVSQGCVDG